jgi:integrase/recombinase XerD
MNDYTLLGAWLKRFLLEGLIKEQNLSRNTQKSYRDTFRLLLPFIARCARKTPDRLTVEDLSPKRIKAFLADLQSTRHCGIATRNQRLAALRSLAHYIGDNSPEHVLWCGKICKIRFAKIPRSTITYLEKPEMASLLTAAEGTSPQQQRDHALMLFLYNTGARADEASNVGIADLHIAHIPERGYSSVTIHGKGNKLRDCPLWPQTVGEIAPLIRGRVPTERVFLNRRQQPITRFGIRTMVKRYAQKAALRMPSLKAKRVTSHSLRHTAATHLLRAGVDINTIRAWLGHVSIDTTLIYAETDLETKAKALALCEAHGKHATHHWRDDKNLMAFLAGL